MEQHHGVAQTRLSFLRCFGVAVAVACALFVAGAGVRMRAAQATQVRADAAQAAPAQTWLRIDTLQVKPEHWNEYRALERDEVIPALRKAGVPSRTAWRTAEFGATYELVLVRPIPDFAAYDMGDSFSQALGVGAAERLRERLRRCLLGRESAAVLRRSDLSVGETGQPFLVVTTLDITPGRNDEYESFLRETLPDVRKAGVVFGVYQRIYGQRTAWMLVQNLDSLRELAAAPNGFFRAFGQETGERRLDKLIGIVNSVERRVFRFDPELSFSYPSAPRAGR